VEKIEIRDVKRCKVIRARPVLWLSYIKAVQAEVARMDMWIYIKGACDLI
jgi:hypothetical protein